MIIRHSSEIPSRDAMASPALTGLPMVIIGGPLPQESLADLAEAILWQGDATDSMIDFDSGLRIETLADAEAAFFSASWIKRSLILQGGSAVGDIEVLRKFLEERRIFYVMRLVSENGLATVFSGTDKGSAEFIDGGDYGLYVPISEMDSEDPRETADCLRAASRIVGDGPPPLEIRIAMSLAA